MNNKSNLVAVAVVSGLVLGAFYLMSLGDSANRSASGSGGVGGLAIGSPAPRFSLQDRNGNIYTNDILKGKNVVLFFNEGIMCYPACWNQMVALAQDGRFSATDTVAFSVVVDQPSSWQGAIQKMPELGYAKVLFDTDKSVSRAYGMLTAGSSMHYGSFPGHSFVVIDKQGVVRSVFDDPNMGIDNDRIYALVRSMAAQSSN